MHKKQPLWQTDFILLLRWILFIPIGFMLTATLQVMPSLVVGLVKANLPESTFLTVAGTIVAIPVLLLLSWVWGMAVLMIPHLSCRFIAPSNGASAVLYGMLFCLFEGTFMISILKGGTSWLSLVYQLIFLGITAGGIVMLYNGIELSRLTKWMLRAIKRSHTTSHA